MWKRAVAALLVLCVGANAWTFGDLSIEDLTCGEQTCYDILYVTQTASFAEIKRSYRRLALEMHPDKSKDPNAPRKFALLAKAYEILSDPNRREAHNAFLEHPARFTALYYGYQTIIPAKTNLIFVFVLILVVVQLGQYFNSRWRYDQTMATIRANPGFKKAVNKAIVVEFGTKFRKLSLSEQDEARRRIEDKVMDESVVFDGFRPKSFDYTDLILFKICMLPVHVWNWAGFNIRWFLRFTIRKESYTAIEHAYLTRKALRLSEEKWNSLEDSDRGQHIDRELWIRENLKRYEEEQAEKAKDARINSAKYRQWKAYKKKNPDTSYMMDMD